MRKIRVSWEYPDIYTRPDDLYMHEDFEVDEDAVKIVNEGLIGYGYPDYKEA